MLSAPPKVRSQLSEALSIISSHDFPAKWQTLLPLLIEKLKSDDQQLVNGVLSTADSIYHRYRWGALPVPLEHLEEGLLGQASHLPLCTWGDGWGPWEREAAWQALLGMAADCFVEATG